MILTRKKLYLHLTFMEVEDTASPALLIALHMYTPESSGTVDMMSNVTKPKSCVVRNRDPVTKYYKKLTQFKAYSIEINFEKMPLTI